MTAPVSNLSAVAADDLARDRIDELLRRVERAELDDEAREAIACLPGRVLALDAKIDRVDGKVAQIDERSKALSDAHKTARSDALATRREVQTLREEMRAEFQEVREAHAAPTAPVIIKSRYDVFKDVMAWLGPIIVVIAAYYLASKGAAAPAPAK